MVGNRDDVGLDHCSLLCSELREQVNSVSLKVNPLWYGQG